MDGNHLSSRQGRLIRGSADCPQLGNGSRQLPLAQQMRPCALVAILVAVESGGQNADGSMGEGRAVTVVDGGRGACLKEGAAEKKRSQKNKN
jgi:hypothetical protein